MLIDVVEWELNVLMKWRIYYNCVNMNKFNLFGNEMFFFFLFWKNYVVVRFVFLYIFVV